MISYSKATLKELTDQGKNLFEAHFEEMYYLEGAKPDYEAMENYYTHKERKDGAFFFLAKNDDEAIGYATYLKEDYPLTPGKFCARMDNTFMLEEYRGMGNGKKFIEYMLDQLKEEGMQGVIHHVRPESDHSKTLEDLEFKLMSKIFIRRF